VDFSARSYTKELLDRDDTPFEDIRQNMRELETINTWLGGHKITIAGLKQLVQTVKSPVDHLSIAEIGCGGGDNLLVIEEWCRKNHITCRLTGIDINNNCIEVAGDKLKNTDHELIHSDYKTVRFGKNKPHIIFSSLFCHHFTNVELQDMMTWMRENSTNGFFINDLHRHPLAYYSIKWITSIFSRSYLVKNDAPLSVRRGFTKPEWENILEHAGIKDYQVKWKWAFRFLVTVPAQRSNN
jgi:ubiquinone/menaquinone biosynthesis C-methylase UbiE